MPVLSTCSRSSTAARMGPKSAPDCARQQLGEFADNPRLVARLKRDLDPVRSEQFGEQQSAVGRWGTGET